MTQLEQVLGVQDLDSAADQLRNVLERLPERAAKAAADAAVAAAKRERDELARRAGELEEQITRTERDSASIDTHVERLNKQMKTIFAPREAEALQHELATLATRRSSLDDVGLEALDGLGEVEEQQNALSKREPELQAAAEAAAEALAVAEADIAERLAGIDSRRAEAAAALPPALLQRYETMRRQFKGVAIARLEGSRCAGCHLDLSRSEVEQVRAQPADDPAECPNCGRWLVR